MFLLTDVTKTIVPDSMCRKRSIQGGGQVIHVLKQNKHTVPRSTQLYSCNGDLIFLF